MQEEKKQSVIGDLLSSPLVKEVVAQHGREIVAAILGVVLGLFRRAPKAPVTVDAAPEPIRQPPVVNVPTPIPTPVKSAARKVATVRYRLGKAERPDMSTQERRQDPGNLYPDPAGMCERGEAFNYGSALFPDITAYDESGDEFLPHSIEAADLEYRTEHRIYDESGNLIAFIKGLGDGNPVATDEPVDWQQQNADEIHWAQRAWKDSLGFMARVRMGREGRFRLVGTVGGVSAEFWVVIS